MPTATLFSLLRGTPLYLLVAFCSSQALACLVPKSLQGITASQGPYASIQSLEAAALQRLSATSTTSTQSVRPIQQRICNDNRIDPWSIPRIKSVPGAAILLAADSSPCIQICQPLHVATGTSPCHSRIHIIFKLKPSLLQFLVTVAR